MWYTEEGKKRKKDDGEFMKKVALFVALLTLMLSIVLIFSLCSRKTEPAKEILSFAGNIQNGGYVIEIGGEYYYNSEEDDCSLYKISSDGKEEKITGGGHRFYEMNYGDGYIYYITGAPGMVNKTSIDGKYTKRLVNQRVGNLLFYNNRMFYRLSEDDDWGKLYSANLNGKDRKLLAQRALSFCIYDGRIYYCDIENESALCSMKLDGTDKVKINDSYTNDLFEENGMLIYSDDNREGRLFLYDIENKVEKCISKDRCWNLNSNKDWIFYRNQSDKGSLYCISFDGSEKHKLVEGNISHIIVTTDYIFYRDIGDKNKIKKYELLNGVTSEPEKYTDIVLSYKTDETVYEHVKDKSYTYKEINITYPVLYTGSDKINALIEREAVSIFDFSYYGDPENLKLDIDYKIAYMDEEIISIIFKGYGDRKYSNHPTYHFYTLNIDLVTGEKLVLSDIVDVDAVINDLNEKNYSFVMYETESVSERYYINDYVEFDKLYSCDSGNSVYSYVTKDGIGLSIPVSHAIGDHKEVEIPIERKR